MKRTDHVIGIIILIFIVKKRDVTRISVGEDRNQHWSFSAQEAMSGFDESWEFYQNTDYGLLTKDYGSKELDSISMQGGSGGCSRLNNNNNKNNNNNYKIQSVVMQGLVMTGLCIKCFGFIV
jgi:hypothetical protein